MLVEIPSGFLFLTCGVPVSFCMSLAFVKESQRRVQVLDVCVNVFVFDGFSEFRVIGSKFSELSSDRMFICR